MANPNTIQVPFFILSTVISFLLLNQNLSTAKDEDLIKESCTKFTKFPATCISTLEVDPRSRAAANFTSLCRAAMQVVEYQANETVVFVSQFLPNASGYEIKSAIENCLRLYTENALEINMTGIRAFDEKNYEGASFYINQARQGAGLCNNSRLPMFFKPNEEFYKFTTVVMNLLKKLTTKSSN